MNTFIANEEPQWIELGGGQRRKIRAYNENAMLVEVGFATGAVGAAHSHPHTQISYVLDGEFTYTVEVVTRSMKKGDSIAVEGGKVHGCISSPRCARISFANHAALCRLRAANRINTFRIL